MNIEYVAYALAVILLVGWIERLRKDRALYLWHWLGVLTFIALAQGSMLEGLLGFRGMFAVISVLAGMTLILKLAGVRKQLRRS